jgi:hypothetical protein
VDRGDSYDRVVPDAEARHGRKRVVAMSLGFPGSFNTSEVGSAVQRRKNIELDRGNEISNLLPRKPRLLNALVVRSIVIAVVLVALTVLWFLTW